MDAYVYQAAMYCKACANRIKELLLDDDGTSDTYPQGPYSNGGGESDSPEHCDSCGVFLENPLTTDGENYVRDCIARTPDSPTVKEWSDFYSYLKDGQ